MPLSDSAVSPLFVVLPVVCLPPLLVAALVSSTAVLPELWLWLVVYSVVKAVGLLRWGEPSWDIVCLLHNSLSVAVGVAVLYTWGTSQDAACTSFFSPAAQVISLQAVHCITDFVFYGAAMLKEPVFIYHHGVLLVVAMGLPYCAGCYHTVTAFTIAEFGSGTIAVDAEWRKLGLQSRGFKRLLFFGGTRVVNLYLLYKILVVTPTTQYFTLSSRGTDMSQDSELLTANIPACMMASVGGSCLMLIINGVTWFRMFGAYRKHAKKLATQGAGGKTAFKQVVDIQLGFVFVLCSVLRLGPYVLGAGWTAPMGEAAGNLLLLVSVGLFLAEPTIDTLFHRAAQKTA